MRMNSDTLKRKHNNNQNDNNPPKRQKLIPLEEYSMYNSFL